ncbi:antibiotic biosynthesis monooxygenase family protein [Bradyrhizobium sp. B120]|uniref:antibiotic biosynthesis monooxygenase family protein n=1 Tax=Bradyrhizobium sp. B120 TaxID=3410088 RepID=UPI003B98740A
MIMRSWKASTDAARASAYESHFIATVLPELQSLPGNKGAYLLKRIGNDRAEILVLSLWDSLEAVGSFAGDDVERAVVEPQAIAVLDMWDSRVQHYEVLHAPQKDNI